MKLTRSSHVKTSLGCARICQERGWGWGWDAGADPGVSQNYPGGITTKSPKRQMAKGEKKTNKSV